MKQLPRFTYPKIAAHAAVVIIIWMTLFGVLFVLFKQWLEAPGQYKSKVLMSARHLEHHEIILEANRSNQFIVDGAINDYPVLLMIDTGASDVSVPKHIADRIGLEAGSARQANTAAGPITVYTTRLDRLDIGPIALRQVRASINPHDRSKSILLGMSALSKLEFYHQSGQLRIRQKLSR